jgi:DNA polymerase III subunit delta'
MAAMTLTSRSAAPPARAGELLPGIDAHPHARAVLVPALPPQGEPSHAYLFHGPQGTGKRTIAGAFAAALLADGAPDAGAVAERVRRRAHPDLTWVTPSGAAEMLVSDIEEPVVASASRTPFESTRRVFVIESVDAMNDQAANRMLKTLEEPPSFAHLLLLTDRREDVLPTIASRCQHVRFDPLPPGRIAELLQGVEGERAQACARLAFGDARAAARLASEEGASLREDRRCQGRRGGAGADLERARARAEQRAQTS